VEAVMNLRYRTASIVPYLPLAAIKHRLSSWIVLTSLLIITVSCGSGDQAAKLDLDANPQPTPVTSAEPATSDVLVLAVAAVNSPVSTFGSYKRLVEFLGAELGIEARFVGGKTYAEINSLVKSGEATMAIVCSGAYVHGDDEFDLELVAVPVIKGETVYYSYLIVHEDSPLETWTDLKGKTFAFTDPLSNSGRLVPLYQISQLGETPSSLFDNYIFTYSHQDSVRAVAGKLVDAAAVDSLVYDYAMDQESDGRAGTKVIWRSQPYGINPVVVNPNLEPGLKEKLQSALYEMHTTESGRAILEELQFDQFVPVEESAYDSIREMSQAIAAWDTH